MKNVLKSILFFAMLTAGSANAAFVDAYDVSNWTQTTDGGSINISGAPGSVALTSSDDGSGDEKNQDFTIEAIQDGYVSFAWNYVTTDFNEDEPDADGPFYDPFGWLLNGVFMQLTNNDGDAAQSGTATFSVLAGEVFGFRANSFDSNFGPATTTVSDFSVVPAAVPVPAAIWLIGAPLMGLLGRKRKATV